MNIELEKFRKAGNVDELNDLLIKLAQKPKAEDLSAIDYCLNNLEKNLLNKIEINLVYLIGELSKKVKIHQKYLNFLLTEYYRSDRWIRNEIVKSFVKISSNQELNKNILNSLSNAINEDYLPIKRNVIELFKKRYDLNPQILVKLIKAMDIDDNETLEKITEILNRNLKNELELFNLLDSRKEYKNINKEVFRSLIVNYIDSIFKLEKFREKIVTSTWEKSNKNNFLNEIKTYEKILLKRL